MFLFFFSSSFAQNQTKQKRKLSYKLIRANNINNNFKRLLLLRLLFPLAFSPFFTFFQRHQQRARLVMKVIYRLASFFHELPAHLSINGTL